jgi:hypothetical protein
MTNRFSGQFQYQWAYPRPILICIQIPQKLTDENCKNVPFFDNSVDVAVVIVVVGIVVVGIVVVGITVVVTVVVTSIFAVVVVANDVFAFE